MDARIQFQNLLRSAAPIVARDPGRIDRILGVLREAIAIPFTVKTRIGFDDTAVFEELLSIFARHSLDLLTVHARTVKEMYRRAPHYDFIARAVAELDRRIKEQAPAPRGR